MYQQAERADRIKAVAEAIATRQESAGTRDLDPALVAELAVSAVEAADKAEHDRRMQARLDRAEQMRRDIAEGRAVRK